MNSSSYDVLGKAMEECGWIDIIGDGLDASFLIKAAAELADKGVQAYNSSKTPKGATAAKAPASATAPPPPPPPSSTGGFVAFLSRRHAGIPTWGWGVGTAGILAGVVLFLRHRR